MIKSITVFSVVKYIVKPLTYILIFLVSGSAVIYAVVWFGLSSSTDGNVIVVFGGEACRDKVAYQIAKENNIKLVLISGPRRSELIRFRKKVMAAADITNLVEPRARTTFENALFSSRLIKTSGANNIVLVTSQYHMPRSYALLKIMLIGSGIGVSIYNVDSKLDSWRMRAKEWMALWYSLSEMIYYFVNGDVPQKSPKQLFKNKFPEVFNAFK